MSLYSECAREQSEYQQAGKIGKTFRCDAMGNFANIQCQGTKCSCHDSHGIAIKGSPTVLIEDEKKLNCKYQYLILRLAQYTVMSLYFK